MRTPQTQKHVGAERCVAQGRAPTVAPIASSCCGRTAPNHTGDWLGTAIVCAAAMLVLGLGTLVYLFDRPSGSAYAIPSAWMAHVPGRSLFGPAGDWLPSFAHAFAFTAFTAVLLPQKWPRYRLAASLWCAIGSGLELGQHPSIAQPLAASLPAWFDSVPVLDHLGRYWLQGSFAVNDLAAVAAGCVTSVLAVMAIEARRAHRPGTYGSAVG